MVQSPSKDDWLKALAEAEERLEEGGLTLNELRALWNRGRYATLTSIRALIAAGKAKEVFEMRRDVTGRRHRTRAFKLL